MRIPAKAGIPYSVAMFGFTCASLLTLRRFGPQALFLLFQLRRHRLAEILRLEDLANFQLGLLAGRVRAALCLLDRLVQ
jgi:hypothetical protein